jgi:predicted amidohydrolase YtcJ
MFIETHMHLTLDGIDSKKYRNLLNVDSKTTENMLRKVFESYKSRGIFAIRDGGDNLGLHEVARSVADEEGLIYRTPIYGIYKKGYYGSIIGKPVEGLDEINKHLDDLAFKKADFIKIVLSGMISFKEYGKVGGVGFNKNEFDYLVKKAQDLSLPVMVHANSFQGVQMAAEAGVDTIEHGYYLKDENLCAMKEKNIIWVPTLAPLGNILYSNDKRYKNVKNVIRRIFEQQCKMIKSGYDMGVKIAVGSDAGSYRVYHGSGFFDELIYLNKSGIGKEELMRIAYENGVSALRISQKEIEAVEDRIIDES